MPVIVRVHASLNQLAPGEWVVVGDGGDGSLAQFADVVGSGEDAGPEQGAMLVPIPSLR
jgi:hypothetical protein